MADHKKYMQRCLELAHRFRGFTAPNPMVGAVLVHNDRIIGEGAHNLYGQAHAEVNCFDSVATADRALIPESVLYVSLEPCAHHGKTPPCADRIVREGVRKVVVCNTDPFEQVSGKGIQILRSHGIQVETGVLEQEGLWLNRRFFTYHLQQRPYIILKWAATSNGFFAPANRSRFQMSDGFSTRLSHQWRTEESAILVGTTTALNDNPALVSRFAAGPQPLRVALDRELQLPVSHKLLSDEYPTWIINEQKEHSAQQLQWIRLEFGEQLLHGLLQRLYQAGKLSLIVEGGAQLLQSFIKAGLWDEARVFLTPPLLQHGLQAPECTGFAQHHEIALEADTLHFFVSANNPYQPVSSGAFPTL